ncbi:MAG: helix-turn-helix domain-containing protein [Chitinophagaceae bacterium]
MGTIILATEEDIKRWMKEAVHSVIMEMGVNNLAPLFSEPLLSREEIVKHLNDISMPTLHAWIKKGLPCHKQEGRVFFLKSEVLEYIKNKKLKAE